MISEISSVDSILRTIIWQSTLFLLAGLVLSYVFRNHSARAHRILLLSIIASVLVPVMTIFVKHLGLGLFEARPAVAQATIEEPQIEISTEPFIFAPTQMLSQPEVPVENATLFEPVQEITEVPSVTSKFIQQHWRLILIISWAVISFVLAARLIITFVLGMNLLRKAEPYNCEKITGALNNAKSKLGIHKEVIIYASKNIKSPVIWCWRSKPALLVPQNAGRFHNRIDWTGILCHELAHWKRRDHICGLIAELVTCILPWNIILWLVKTRMINLSEHACDDWVIATIKTGTDYAESLLDLTPGGQMAFVPAVVRDKSGLAQRVKRILKDSCGNPKTGFLWAISVCIIACFVAVTVAFAQTRPARTTSINNVNDNNIITSSDIGDNDPVTTKIYILKYSSPEQIAQKIEPLLSDKGYLKADETTGSLIVIDKNSVLPKIEKVISDLDKEPEPEIHEQIFEVKSREPYEIVQILQILLKDRISTNQITLLPFVVTHQIDKNWIMVKASSEDMMFIQSWIAKLDRKDSYLPDGWDLYYDNGITPERGKSWPANMAENLASLEILPRPIYVKDESWKNERFVFRIYSLDGTEIGNLMVRPEPEMKEMSSKILQPGTYLLKYEREYKEPKKVYDMYCNSILLDIRQAGMYKLYFSPKLGYGEISGSSDGCYAVNFEKVDSSLPLWGLAYINREKEYDINGLPDGTYRLSAVSQQNNGNVIVSQSQVTIENGSKVTENVAPPPKGNCSLTGSILGKKNTYTVGKTNPTQKVGEWFVLLRNHGSGQITTLKAYEARSMDSLYVIRGSENIVQENSEKANFKIQGIYPGTYTVTVVEDPFYDGFTIIRQQSKTITINPEQEATLDFDLRDTKEQAELPNQNIYTNRMQTILSDSFISTDFSQMDINDIIKTIIDCTGKAVIPSKEAMNLQLKIFTPIHMRKSEALKLLYKAMRENGFIAAEKDNIIYIKPAQSDPGLPILTLKQDESLENLQDKDQIVKKIYKLKYYNVSEMGQIILPFLDSNGYLMADESTNTMMVMDTVKTLIRIEQIIKQYDVPEKNMLTRIFQFKYSFADKIAETVNKILQLEISPLSSEITLVPEMKNNMLIVRTGSENMEMIENLLAILDTPEKAAVSNEIKTTSNIRGLSDTDFDKITKLLGILFNDKIDTKINAEGAEKILSITASPSDNSKIGKLIEWYLATFIKKNENNSDSENDAEQIGPPSNEFILETSPEPRSTDRNPATHQEPNRTIQNQFPESNWSLSAPIIKTEKLEQIEIEKLVKELKKIYTEDKNYETIVVKYSDVNELAANIITILDSSGVDFSRNISIMPLTQSKQLIIYGKKEYRDIIRNIIAEIDVPNTQLQRKVYKLQYANVKDVKDKLDELFGDSSTPEESKQKTISKDTLITVAYPSLKQIVVMASIEKMKEIEKLIKEWDSPVMLSPIYPRIYTMNHVDAKEIADFLSSIFSSSSESGDNLTIDTLKQNPLIAMYKGKITIIYIPDTKKILADSQIVEGYQLIDAIIKEIDKTEFVPFDKDKAYDKILENLNNIEESLKAGKLK